MAGKNVQSAADELKRFSEETLYQKITHPAPEIEARIRQLRALRQIDIQKYNEQKRALPYFVCGIFQPPFRRTENFACIDTLVLDIDKLSAKGLQLDQTRELLQQDERVLLCFASPSNDGLKIMFRLKERCYDHGLYSHFYKIFARQFSTQYALEQVVDSKTSDVTRACFISCDPQAYYNPQAQPIDWQAICDANEDTRLFPAATSEKPAAYNTTPDTDTGDKEKPAREPSDEIMRQIKQRLNPNGRPAPERPETYVPQQLADIAEPLRDFIEEMGLQVKEIINIQYGKKIRANLGLKEAEVNLFYGRRGYTITKTPRRGTSPQLNELLEEIVRTYLDNA